MVTNHKAGISARYFAATVVEDKPRLALEVQIAGSTWLKFMLFWMQRAVSFLAANRDGEAGTFVAAKNPASSSDNCSETI